MHGTLRGPQFGPYTFSRSCIHTAPLTSRHPELRIPAHSHPTSLPCTLRLSHTHTPRSRKPKLSFLPRSPTPGPLAPSPRPPAPSLAPATPGQCLGVTSPHRLTGRTHTAWARPPHSHSGELGPPPEPPPRPPPPPLTLALKLADDGVQEGVLRRDVAPPHRHPEPMGGPGGPPPTPARPGPTQASGGPTRPWSPHPAARQSTGGARTGVRARGLRSAPAPDRGPGLELPELGPPGRPHTCLPAPAEPRAPLRRVSALRSACSSAGLPAPARCADSRSGARGSGCACCSARPRKG